MPAFVFGEPFGGAVKFAVYVLGATVNAFQDAEVGVVGGAVFFSCAGGEPREDAGDECHRGGS